jgi:hypothetical protein
MYISPPCSHLSEMVLGEIELLLPEADVAQPVPRIVVPLVVTDGRAVGRRRLGSKDAGGTTLHYRISS